MYLDTTEIVSNKYGKVHFSEGNFYWGGQQDKTLSLRAAPSFGSISQDEIRDEDYTIWRTEFNIEEAVSLSFRSAQPSLFGLTFTLSHDLAFKTEGVPEGISREHQYTFYYLPEVKCELNLSQGKYLLFGIHFSMKYLRKWMAAFPFFVEFINKIDGKTFQKMTDDDPSISQEMMEVINDLNTCKYPGTQRKMFMEAKVLELLRLSLERIITNNYNFSTSTFRESDIKKIKEIHEYLANNPDNNETFEALAHRFGINNNKLKNGFKKIYGITAFKYRHKLKMQKARKLILETDLPLKTIAVSAGYNFSHFSHAFKKAFGVSPREMKRGYL